MGAEQAGRMPGAEDLGFLSMTDGRLADRLHEAEHEARRSAGEQHSGQYEGGLGSRESSPLQNEAGTRSRRRQLLFVPWLAALCVAMGLGGCWPVWGQQPVVPTQQPPNPKAPKEDEKRVPPVPPGSVLPSYNQVQSQPPAVPAPVPTSDQILGWKGLKVLDIQYKGVQKSDLEPLPEQLPQQPNQPLDPVKVRDSLRRLYATGLFNTIAVDGQKEGDGVVLTFTGEPRLFVGRVLVRGVRSAQLNNQLNYSTRMNPGTPFTQPEVARATDLLQETLQENGYYSSSIVHHTKVDPAHALEDIQFNVQLGNRARVGNVEVAGDSGMNQPTFRKKAKLKAGSKVNRETITHALANVRKTYQKEQRLAPNVTLTAKQYDAKANRLNLTFRADRGPVIKVVVEGARLSHGKIKALVPIFAEGTLDEDLLNAGSKRIRDYFQREGYFEAKVKQTSESSGDLTRITYDVTLGPQDRVASVAVKGNHYFDTYTLGQRLSVQPASFFMHHGSYSLALQTADVNAITALYQSNGFTNVKVTPEVKTVSVNSYSQEHNLAVTYQIDEGVQQKVGTYTVHGVTPAQLKEIELKLSLQPGQPYSGDNLASDRDAILGWFLDNGYDHAKVTLEQRPSPKDPNLIDVTLNVDPGNQIFIRNIVMAGLHYTKKSTIEHQVLAGAGQPLDQSKLLETQRQLYNLTLFNQVNVAVENPGGDELRKNVLLQFDEARRWDVVYGGGLQAQTGTPNTNCPNAVSLIQLGINPATFSCGPGGHFGVSPLVELDVSRINLFGRNQTISFKSQYGTLEQLFTTQYDAPRFLNHPSLAFSLGGGYINAQNVVTFASSTAEGDIRLTQHPDLINTLIYQVSYRRVKVDPNTIQVAPNLIPLLSEPVRVGGPELTWIRDTRRPEPLDARSGMYNSIQEFATDHQFLTSEANFNHFDWTNSTYYQIGKHKDYVLARNTRFGMERVFGEGRYESIPLPERLYAGGPQSLRGFSLNSAGPRDSITGFPIGGAGVFVNQTELRFPNPQLPYFGTALGFILFHDMGNVFNNSSDIWRSILRIKQPHSYTCTAPQYLSADVQQQVTRSSSTNRTGTCDFNDFSHTLGVGARYHTPIGPIRVDLGYNLNPPVYPVIVTYGKPTSGTCVHGDTSPCYGQAGHFNFFFSIGQAF